MKVYVVSSGEKHEGSCVEGVYDSLEKARASVDNIKCCFEGGWIEEEDNYWINGCDFVIIQDKEIK